MKQWVSRVGIVLVAALALYGGLQLSVAVRALYDDWLFLRAARVQALQRAATAARQPAPSAQPPSAPNN